MPTHPDFAQLEDCNPNPENDSMTDDEFFEFYGDPVDQLPFEDLTEAQSIEELYNRG